MSMHSLKDQSTEWSLTLAYPSIQTVPTTASADRLAKERGEDEQDSDGLKYISPIQVGGRQSLLRESGDNRPIIVPSNISILEPTEMHFWRGFAVEKNHFLDGRTITKPYSVPLNAILHMHLGNHVKMDSKATERTYVVDHGHRYMISPRIEPGVEYALSRSPSSLEGDQSVSEEFMIGVDDAAAGFVSSSSSILPRGLRTTFSSRRQEEMENKLVDKVQVDLAPHAQFVVDPQSGATYMVRKVYHVVETEGNSFNEALLINVFSELERSPKFLMPLVHPYTGGLFDVCRWGTKTETEPFADPAYFQEFFRSQASGEVYDPQKIEKESLNNSFMWRPRDIRISMITPWEGKRPWVQLVYGERIGVDPETHTLYRLTPVRNPVASAARAIGSCTRILRDIVDNRRIWVYGTGIAEAEVLPSDEPKISLEEASTYNKLQRREDIKRLLYFCRALEKHSTVPLSQHQKARRPLSDVYPPMVKGYDRHFSVFRKIYRRMQIQYVKFLKHQEQAIKIDKCQVTPPCYLVVSRHLRELYIAQRLIYLTKEVEIYSPEDLVRASTFAELGDDEIGSDVEIESMSEKTVFSLKSAKSASEDFMYPIEVPPEIRVRS